MRKFFTLGQDVRFLRGVSLQSLCQARLESCVKFFVSQKNQELMWAKSMLLEMDEVLTYVF